MARVIAWPSVEKWLKIEKKRFFTLFLHENIVVDPNLVRRSICLRALTLSMTSWLFNQGYLTTCEGFFTQLLDETKILPQIWYICKRIFEKNYVKKPRHPQTRFFCVKQVYKVPYSALKVSMFLTRFSSRGCQSQRTFGGVGSAKPSNQGFDSRNCGI